MSIRKTISIIILTILILLVSGAYIFWDSTMHSPSNYKVTYLDAEDDSIPSNLKGVNILYFTDLEYGQIFNQNYLDSLKETINQLDYDVIVFGGDVFDENYTPMSEDVEIVSNFFSSLECDLGKFFILGDYDKTSDTRTILAKKILGDSGFELINGEMKLYNGSNGFIALYGQSYDEDPITVATETTYSIGFIHTTEYYRSLSDSLDMVVAGNGHKWQINFFVSDSYGLGKSGKLYQCSSIGMNKMNYRLFNNPEIIIIRLK